VFFRKCTSNRSVNFFVFTSHLWAVILPHFWYIPWRVCVCSSGGYVTLFL
jgi:hypothetical protein